MYDIDSNLDGKWGTSTHASSETLGGYEQHTNSLIDQMKNLRLKNNNYIDDGDSEKSLQSSPDKNSEKSSKNNNKKYRKHRVPIMAPHFVSHITFDNYGSQDIHARPRYRRVRKMVPHFHSTFKIAYDKEELEKDNMNRPKKPISPTYISHIFDKDDTVRKVRPIRKNDIFYENIYFNDFSDSQMDIKPPVVVRDKYISNIFNKNLADTYVRHKKPSSDPRNQAPYSNFRVERSGEKKQQQQQQQQDLDVIVEGEEEEEDVTEVDVDERVVERPTSPCMVDHMNKIFSDPSEDNLVHPVVNPIPKNCINYTTFKFDDPPEPPMITYTKPKDKFVSHLFRGDSLEDSEVPVPKVVNRDINERSDLYNIMYGRTGNQGFFTTEIPRGIKTQYKHVDHIKEILRGTNEKLNFNDIRMYNSIHNSMHPHKQRQVESQRV